MIYISLYVSVLTLAVLTIERVLAVKRPLYYNRLEYKKKYFICFSMWIVTGVGITLHHIAVNNHEEEYIKTPLLILLTAFFVCSSYFVILRTLKKRRLQLRSNMNTNTSDTNVFNVSEKRFLSFCIKSCIIFLVCWLPLASYGIALSGGFITTWKYKDYFDFITHIIAFWNSVASPIMFLHHNWKLNRTAPSSSSTNETTTSVWSGYQSKQWITTGLAK